MEITIVALLGYDKWDERVAEAKKFGFVVTSSLHTDIKQAREAATKLAGRGVRAVPHFFVGKPPAEGKGWVRERYGGSTFFENLLTKPKGGESTTGKEPVNMVSQVRSNVTDDDRLKRAVELQQMVEAAVENDETPNFASLSPSFLDVCLALTLQSASVLESHKSIIDGGIRARAEIVKVKRDAGVDYRVCQGQIVDLQDQLATARLGLKDETDCMRTLTRVFYRMESLAARMADRANQVKELLDRPPSRLENFQVDHAMHEAFSLRALIAQLQDGINSVVKHEANTAAPPAGEDE